MSGSYIITGAASPLGIALYNELLKKKIHCFLIVHDKRKLKGLEGFDKSLYEVWESDLSCTDEVEKLCEKVLTFKYSVNAFVHLAAASNEDNFDLDAISTVFKVNVFSAWKLAQACIIKMTTAHGGRILFVGSIGHKFGGKASRAGYSGSKYLLEYFPKPFRECGSKNILINTLRLGVMRGGTQVATNINDNAFRERLALIPTGKSVSHSEAVRNILFLCSFQNESIHNTTFSCSGGE